MKSCIVEKTSPPSSSRITAKCLTYVCGHLEPQQILLLGPCLHLHSSFSSITSPFFFPAPAEDKLLSGSAFPVAVVCPSERTSCPDEQRGGQAGGQAGGEDRRGQTLQRAQFWVSTDFHFPHDVLTFIRENSDQWERKA